MNPKAAEPKQRLEVGLFNVVKCWGICKDLGPLFKERKDGLKLLGLDEVADVSGLLKQNIHLAAYQSSIALGGLVESNLTRFELKRSLEHVHSDTLH